MDRIGPAPENRRGGDRGEENRSNVFRVFLWPAWAFALAVKIAFCLAAIRIAGLLNFDIGDIQLFDPAGVAVLTILFGFRYAVYGWAILRIWRIASFAAQVNVDLRIDRRRKLIEFRNVFGLNKIRFDRDKLIEFTVKYRWGVQMLCLVLDGHVVDPVAHLSLTTRGTRRALRRMSGVLEASPWDWLDVSYALPTYSEMYKKRVLRVFNPYYEG